MKNKNSKGFTLIEAVISIVVLSIAIGALITVFTNVVKFSVAPEVLNVSDQLAERELDRVTGLRYSEITSHASTAFGGNFPNYSYQVVVSAVPAAIANDPTMAQYKQVQVIVTHTINGSITLSTIVTNH